MRHDIRPSPIAGTWYPGAADTLKTALSHYLGEMPENSYSDLLGLVVPHAGLRFCGGVAGKAFRHLQGRAYDVVVVIAPSHHPYPAALLTSGHSAFQTPLGLVPVAQDLIQALRGKIDLVAVKNDPEHAIEIELPFLQYLLGEFELLPLAMLDQSYAAAHSLAQRLSEILKAKKVLYIASSDLSHFYSQTVAQRLDQQVLEAIVAYDVPRVINAAEQGRGIACGRGAIATVMLACTGAQASIEAYATSGDVTLDYARVVGYGAATIHNALR